MNHDMFQTPPRNGDSNPTLAVESPVLTPSPSPPLSHSDLVSVQPTHTRGDPSPSSSPKAQSALHGRIQAAVNAIHCSTQNCAEAALQQASAATAALDVVQALSQELEWLQQELSSTAAQLTSERHESEQLRQALMDAQRQLLLQKEGGEVLMSARHAAEADVGRLKDQLREEAERCSVLQQTIEEQGREIDRLQDLQLQARKEQAAMTTEQSAAASAFEHEHVMRVAAEEARNALQRQVTSMVKAERELTKNLREAHAQIEHQMIGLKEEVKQERRAKEAAKKKRTELHNEAKELREKCRAHQLEVSSLQGQLRQSREQVKALRADLKLERRRASDARAEAPSGHALVAEAARPMDPCEALARMSELVQQMAASPQVLGAQKAAARAKSTGPGRMIKTAGIRGASATPTRR